MVNQPSMHQKYFSTSVPSEFPEDPFESDKRSFFKTDIFDTRTTNAQAEHLFTQYVRRASTHADQQKDAPAQSAAAADPKSDLPVVPPLPDPEKITVPHSRVEFGTRVSQRRQRELKEKEEKKKSGILGKIKEQFKIVRKEKSLSSVDWNGIKNRFSTTWKDLPRVLKEAGHHYWAGTKLLGFNIRTTFSIGMRSLSGQQMTRRERRLLVRTVGDLFRLVPFSVFVIVPFLEFTLPIFLKIFPNMLPSTFEDKLKKEENLKKQLRLKIEMAKFLQDTLEEVKVEKMDPQFVAFIQKLRNGEYVDPIEVTKFAKFFEDEWTLDTLTRPQLVAMCRLLNLKVFGPDSILRIQVERRIEQLKKDDEAIKREGIENLTLEELQSACIARGMPGSSKSIYMLRQRLNEWLELSLEKKVPPTLLILSRAISINSKAAATKEMLKDTMMALPQELIDAIDLEMKERSGKVDRALKLEVLEQLRERITEEVGQREKKAAPKSSTTSTATDATLKNIDDEKLKAISHALATMAKPSSVELERQSLAELKRDVIEHIEEVTLDQAMEEALLEHAARIKFEKERLAKEKKERDEAEAKRSAEKAVQDQKRLAEEQQQLAAQQKLAAEKIAAEKQQKEQAAAEAAKATSVEVEPAAPVAPAAEKPDESKKAEEEKAIEAEKQKLAEEEKRQAAELEKAKAKEQKLRKHLESKVSNLIKEIDAELQQVDEQLGQSFNIIDKNKDGMIDREEIVAAMKMMKEQFTDVEINSIIEKLDKDHDGVVKVDDLEKMARELIDLRTAMEEQKRQEKEEQEAARAKEAKAKEAAAANVAAEQQASKSDQSPPSSK
jgi:LETM1 and EF-hand domain-containing protein 1